MVTRLIFKAHTIAQVDSVSVITTPLWLQPFYSPTHSLFGQKNHISCEYNNHLSIFPIEVCHYTLKYYLSCAPSWLPFFHSHFHYFFFFISMFDSGTLISLVHTIIDQFTIDCFSVFDLINPANKDQNRLLSLFYLPIEKIHNNSITSDNLTQPFFVCLSL